MLNTKLLLVLIALVASIAGFEAYRHRQDVARRKEDQKFWEQVEQYRQKGFDYQKPKPKATNAFQYRVP